MRPDIGEIENSEVHFIFLGEDQSSFLDFLPETELLKNYQLHENIRLVWIEEGSKNIVQLSVRNWVVIIDYVL